MVPFNFALVKYYYSSFLAQEVYYSKCDCGGIANIFSPYGLLDVAVGVGIAIISYTLIIKFKNKFVNIGLYSLCVDSWLD